MYGLPILVGLIAFGLIIYYREFLTSIWLSGIQFTDFKNLSQKWVEAGGAWGPANLG